METEKKKILLYERRSFSAKFEAVFDFIKENKRPLGKFFLYLMLPLSMIQAFGSMHMVSFLVESVSVDFLEDPSGLLRWLSYTSIVSLCTMVGYVLLTALLGTLLQLYQMREGRLSGLTMHELRPALWSNVVRMLRVLLLEIVLVAALYLLLIVLFMLTPYTLLLTFPALLLVLLQLMLFPWVYLFEKKPLLKSLSRTFTLGFTTFGGFLLFIFVLSLLAGVFSGVTAVPMYVVLFIKILVTTSEASVSAGWLSGLFLFLASLLQMLGSYAAMILVLLGSAYHYGHAAEVSDGISVQEDIDKFEEL